MNELKSFAEKGYDVVSMEYKHMTDELEEISLKFPPKLYTKFSQKLKKLFLSNGQI